MSDSKAPSAPLRVGVLLCGASIQLLDLAAVDLLAMLSPTYLRICHLPDNIVALGREVELHYIADSIKGADGLAPTEASTTAYANVRVTDTLDSVGDLDIIFIPGPELSYVPSADAVAFLQQRLAKVRAVLVVCSGILPVAFSGILANKRATAPLGLIPILKEKLPNVNWVAKRWTTDSDDVKERKIWTSGAVTNGTDMVSAYLREGGLVDPELAKFVIALADTGDREQDYPKEQVRFFERFAIDLDSQHKPKN